MAQASMSVDDMAFAPDWDTPAVAIFARDDLSGRELADDVALLGGHVLRRSRAGTDAIGNVAIGGCDLLIAEIRTADALEWPADLAASDSRMASRPSLIVTDMEFLDVAYQLVHRDAGRSEIVVGNSRAERLAAIGGLLVGLSDRKSGTVADRGNGIATEEIRQLTDAIARLSDRLEQLGPGARPIGLVASPATGFRAEGRLKPARSNAVTAPMVRRLIKSRRLRAQFFDDILFSDPAWDMLLDLTAARLERQPVSVTSLCIAAHVPPTTALRWIEHMTEAGLFVRSEDRIDGRRAFIALADKTFDAMQTYLALTQELLNERAS